MCKPCYGKRIGSELPLLECGRSPDSGFTYNADGDVLNPLVAATSSRTSVLFSIQVSRPMTIILLNRVGFGKKYYHNWLEKKKIVGGGGRGEGEGRVGGQ